MNKMPCVVNGETPQCQLVRARGRERANAEDASLWEWYSEMMEASRIRWRHGAGLWQVSLDYKHVATERNFDDAVRAAKAVAQHSGRPHVRRSVHNEVHNAELWRWFSLLMEESLVRWCHAGGAWLAIVGHKHLATEASFALAIEVAKAEWESRALATAARRPARTAVHR